MAYSSSYDLSSITHTQYGVDGDYWNDPTDQSVSDDDRNRYYLGQGYWADDTLGNWRCRLYFTIPSSITISGTSQIIISLAADSTFSPNRMRAFLSTKNTSSSNWDHIVGATSTDADRLAMSYLYADLNGTRQTSTLNATNSKTATCYLIFNYNFVPGTTYYIYFMPYSSDSHAVGNPTFSGTWCRWRNLPDYTNVTLNYNSGTVRIYTNNGWVMATPYVYTGTGPLNGWAQAIPYVYTGSGGTNGWNIAT